MLQKTNSHEIYSALQRQRRGTTREGLSTLSPVWCWFHFWSLWRTSWHPDSLPPLTVSTYPKSLEPAEWYELQWRKKVTRSLTSMFFWWHHWPRHRKGWGTASTCEPVWHWFTFHLHLQAAPQPDSSHLPHSSGGPSGLSPSKPRPPSQMRSSLQKEGTESLRWTPGQKDGGLNDKCMLEMLSLME